MKGNWFAVNRAMFDHWVSSREDWFFAWQRILSLADFETAEVNLTLASRDSSMSPSAWRHFVSKLEMDGMVDRVTTVRRGGMGGSTTTARVTNWAKYQPQRGTDSHENLRRSERRSERRYNDSPNDGPNDSPTRDPDEPSATQATVPTTLRAQRNDSPGDGPNDVQYKNPSSLRSEGITKEGGSRAPARATPPPPPFEPDDRPDAAEAAHQVMHTGLDPTTREHQVRERIRRCAGKTFQLEHADDIPRWSREHPPDRIDELWEAAKPELWRGTAKADKRRIWIFEDLLNQDVLPPAEAAADDPLAQYTELGL